MLIADAGHQNILGFSQLNLPLRENQNVSILVNLDNDMGFTMCVAKTSRVPASSLGHLRFREDRDPRAWSLARAGKVGDRIEARLGSPVFVLLHPSSTSYSLHSFSQISPVANPVYISWSATPFSVFWRLCLTQSYNKNSLSLYLPCVALCAN